MTRKSRILMIYTGGTIGMVPEDPSNPDSPLIPADWSRLKRHVPPLESFPVEAVLHAMDLIDSSDMTPAYWIEIARVIHGNYDDFEGFLILHGTDTMAYTASALAFLLENLGKPVIITGSQLSIAQPRSDAVQNFVTSLMLAAPHAFNLPLVPEVCIFFHEALLRGVRSRKISSSGYAAFASPNYPALARAGEHIRVNEKAALQMPDSGLFLHENLETNVMMFDIFPGMKPDFLARVLSAPGLKGLVLKTYGAGNAPTSKEFLMEIEKAVQSGVALISVTQCSQGLVEMGRYGASAGLEKAGAISGGDMTSEAALTKMMFLLGQGCSPEDFRRLMQKSLRGELSEEK